MKLTPEQIEVRRQLAVRSGGHCEAQIVGVCTHRARHPHHRKLKKQGGRDDLATFLHVDFACHRYIHDHPAWSYQHGLLVHSWDDPAEIPCLPGATPVT